MTQSLQTVENPTTRQRANDILSITRKLEATKYFVINEWNLGTRLRVREKGGGEARPFPSFLAHPSCFLQAQNPLSLESF